MTTRHKKVPLKTLLGEDDDEEEGEEGEVVITPVLPKSLKQGRPRSPRTPLGTPNKPVATPTKPRVVSTQNKPPVSTSKKPVVPTKTETKKPVKISVPTLPTPLGKEIKQVPVRPVAQEHKIPQPDEEMAQNTEIPAKIENTFIEKSPSVPHVTDGAMSPQSLKQKRPAKDSSGQVN